MRDGKRGRKRVSLGAEPGEAKRQLAEETDEVELEEDLWHLARDQSQLLKESYTTSPQMEEEKGGVRE